MKNKWLERSNKQNGLPVVQFADDGKVLNLEELFDGVPYKKSSDSSGDWQWHQRAMLVYVREDDAICLNADRLWGEMTLTVLVGRRKHDTDFYKSSWFDSTSNTMLSAKKRPSCYIQSVNTSEWPIKEESNERKTTAEA